MMIRFAAVASSLALAACAPATEETAQEGIATPELPVAATNASQPAATPGAPAAAGGALPAGELPGEYRVAGVDGRSVDLPHAITVSIGPETIRYTSQCVTGAWNYRFEGGALVTDPVVEPVCDRGRYREEEALDAVFAAPEAIRRTPANGIELSGGGHTVTLFSQ